jgi:hypothetical protein
MKLIDERTKDGSRQFACLPQTVAWSSICEHAAFLPGAEVLNTVAGAISKAWFEFCFCRHRFMVDAEEGLVRLIVNDPQCADLILYQVGCHFEKLLVAREGKA